MTDDIIEIKPGIGPVKLNLRALWRQFSRSAQSGSVALVGQRFLQLFEKHGVAISQIPRLLPAVNLAALNHPETLLPTLTPAVLEQTAQLFGIQRTWIEGTTDRIYRTYPCYKHPTAFFKLLSRLHYEPHAFPVRALTSAKTLNNRDSSPQHLVLVLVEKIAIFGDFDSSGDVERYHILGDDWDWSYTPCRLQLKAMARIMDQVFDEGVPLICGNESQIELVRSGQCVPYSLIHDALLTNPSLEDYALSESESHQAKEICELPAVLAYIRQHGLTAQTIQNMVPT